METEALSAFIAAIADLPIEKLVKLTLKTRLAKSANKKDFDAREAQFNTIMDACENQMLKKADIDGVTGFSTPFGTTYVAETTRLSIADDAAFFDFVKKTGDLDFFERRVSATHVANYMKNSGDMLPPGLNSFRTRVMRVRKAGDK
jgi:hypothetical protein